ncbi:MAG: SUMF1/EgtB/PvdO family nonheme iron enzyme [Symploca sp. SIO1C2]|nr:SUMF1/EgtB/PvdO family nonheme iron enzyme [Symploca sp. SIO1C2]
MAKNWAIAVGINRYDNLQSLNYAKRDAECMGNFFQQEASFERVFLFTEDSPAIPTTPPISTQPTYGKLRRFLRKQFEKPLLEPGDNLWFFFSGHGQISDNRDYLLLSDTDPGDVNYTALPVNYVTERLRQSGADNVILVLDACRNQGSKAGEGIGKEQQKGMVTIYSCSPQEKAYEIESLQQGSFTYCLLEALRIQGEGNCATVERLDQYLRHRVPEINRQYQKPQQTPYAIAEPVSKHHLILLPRYATLRDIETLKKDAYRAEVQGKWELAKQLWIRVNVAASGSDTEAIEAFVRIAQQQVLSAASQGSTNDSSGSILLPGTKESKQELSVEKELPVTNALEKKTTTKTTFQPPASSTLSVFDFDVVTVDAKGQTIDHSKSQASYFTEDLGKEISLEMVVIPAGSFQMGSPETEKGHSDDESPQHQVNVASFCMGKYPVTQAQWQAVAALPQINRILDPNPSKFQGKDLPVEQVSWYDAVEFCSRLSQKTERKYRLPSEAEWEYACRANTTTPFHFGETITPELANYSGNYTYGSGPKSKAHERTTPVGSFKFANSFGLYDMHGNVWEWCADHWHDNYKGAPTDGKVWLADNDNYPRMLGGGSWGSGPWDCRGAGRLYVGPDDRDFNFGFRVVCPAAWTL